MGLFDFGVEDVHAVVSGHDPAQTRVEDQGDWLRVEIGRPAREGAPAGLGQTIYLYRRGALHADGTRPPRTAAELRADLALLLVDEFRRASAPPGDAAEAETGTLDDPAGARSSSAAGKASGSARRSRAAAGGVPA